MDQHTRPPAPQAIAWPTAAAGAALGALPQTPTGARCGSQGTSATSATAACDAGSCTSPPSTRRPCSRAAVVRSGSAARPHVAFSRDICRISRRISASIIGRPGFFRDFHRQYSLKPSRCQRITVSGLHGQQALTPARPEVRQPNPQDPITLSKSRAFCRALKDAELVAKSQSLCGERCTREKKHAEQDDDKAHGAHAYALSSGYVRGHRTGPARETRKRVTPLTSTRTE